MLMTRATTHSGEHAPDESNDNLLDELELDGDVVLLLVRVIVPVDNDDEEEEGETVNTTCAIRGTSRFTSQQDTQTDSHNRIDLGHRDAESPTIM
jgi:hypothetical protein